LPFLHTALARQRFKLIAFVWSYWRLLTLQDLPLTMRLRCVWRFLLIDWRVPHAHNPAEFARLAQRLGRRSNRRGEIVVEAGCWQGGSTAKLSVLADAYGLQLHVYDSFEGVADVQEGELDFRGSYASPLRVAQANVQRFGNIDICTFHPGWFEETVAVAPPEGAIACVYIDCDLARGTREVLGGVAPGLTEDALVFTQDYHIPAVREMLGDFSIPAVPIVRNLALLDGAAIRDAGLLRARSEG
jgi:O-methyltransferase